MTPLIITHCFLDYCFIRKPMLYMITNGPTNDLLVAFIRHV